MAEDKEIMIGAWLAALERKITFIEEISNCSPLKYEYKNTPANVNPKDIALLICVCYIDGLGGIFYGKKGSKNNFINILTEVGGDKIFCAIHPRILSEYLESKIKIKKNKELKEIYLKLKEFLSALLNENTFFTENEIMDRINKVSLLSVDQITCLKKILKHGSYAAHSYIALRCSAVHNLEPQPTVFKNVTFLGEPVEKMDFPVFIKALKNIYAETKKIPTEEFYKKLFPPKAKI